MDGASGSPVLGDGDPEAEGLGRGAASGDVDGDGLPQPHGRCVGASSPPPLSASFLHALHAELPVLSTRGQRVLGAFLRHGPSQSPSLTAKQGPQEPSESVAAAASSPRPYSKRLRELGAHDALSSATRVPDPCRPAEVFPGLLFPLLK